MGSYVPRRSGKSRVASAYPAMPVMHARSVATSHVRCRRLSEEEEGHQARRRGTSARCTSSTELAG